MSAVLGGQPLRAKKEDEPKEAKMSVPRMLGFVEAFNQRPNAEFVVPLSDIANRTVFAHLHESAVGSGVWPQGEQTAVNAMAPFANSLGVFNTTDIPSLMLNPKSGHVEDANRDPTAAPAKSTKFECGAVDAGSCEGSGRAIRGAHCRGSSCRDRDRFGRPGAQAGRRPPPGRG